MNGRLVGQTAIGYRPFLDGRVARRAPDANLESDLGTFRVVATAHASGEIRRVVLVRLPFALRLPHDPQVHLE